MRAALILASIDIKRTGAQPRNHTERRAPNKLPNQRLNYWSALPPLTIQANHHQTLIESIAPCCSKHAPLPPNQPGSQRCKHACPFYGQCLPNESTGQGMIKMKQSSHQVNFLHFCGRHHKTSTP